MQTETKPNHRYKVQIFLSDMETDQDKTVIEAYAIGSPEKEGAQLCYDMVIKVIQLFTHKPIV